jgi:hypothetical protein
MVPKWLYGTVLAVLALHFVTPYIVFRSGDAAPTSGDSVRNRERSANSDSVECVQCGAENERGYQFCRVCVSKLPGASVRRDASGASRTRRLG